MRGKHFSFVFFLCLVLASLNSVVNAKTILRRADKISENFKQLDLTPEEIDPNVAPPELPKPQGTVAEIIGTVASEAEDSVADEADEGEAPAASVVDESANEVDGNIAAIAEVTAAAPAAAAPSPSPAAVAATTVAAPTETTTSGLSKYCKCKDSQCDCCRKFNLPLIPISGPGCARISYLGNEKMSVSIKYGDITLASRTISSKNARPICVGLPGGYSKFCGRVYGLSKAAKNDFKACLGFELRADDEVEAALRVSCFKFGPEGLRVAEGEPLPSPPKDEDDDDDDIFGFAAGDGDDEDDEDDYADEPEEEDDDTDDDEDEAEAEEDDDVEAPEDADYGGFSLGGLLAELDDDDEETASSSKPVAVASITPPSVDETRGVAIQSKDDKGSEVVDTVQAAPSVVAETADAIAAEATPAVVTPAPTGEVTTVKTKKSKKSKKNKKKKAAATSDSETGFAYELLNGLLDFFN